MWVVLVASVTVQLASTQAPSWQPAPGHNQIPIWPGTPPDAQPASSQETVGTETKSLVAGKPWRYLGMVSRPTITVYAPTGKNTGAAVLVLPGGGYQILAIDLEGTEVCDWLTSRGVTCVLLKYRVPGEGRYPKSGAFPHSPQALEDAQRAMGLVRLHAQDWGVDPHKIGVLGFSAGGHLAVAMSTHYLKRVYSAVDAVDHESCRPDFAVVLYPGHLWLDTDPPRLNPDIRVTHETPATFLLQAENDPVDNIKNSLVYFAALKSAGVPAEMHIYGEGGHGFGLRPTKFPITEWPQLVEKWMRMIGVVKGD
jgi:acetyl esterase/lipase